jgi:hypothetical protein
MPEPKTPTFSFKINNNLELANMKITPTAKDMLRATPAQRSKMVKEIFRWNPSKAEKIVSKYEELKTGEQEQLNSLLSKVSGKKTTPKKT